MGFRICIEWDFEQTKILDENSNGKCLKNLEKIEEFFDCILDDKILEKIVFYTNLKMKRPIKTRMKSRQDQEEELPLFDEIAVQRLMDAFQIIKFNQPLRLGDGLQITYYASGHIAGAGMIVFESEDGTLVMSAT